MKIQNVSWFPPKPGVYGSGGARLIHLLLLPAQPSETVIVIRAVQTNLNVDVVSHDPRPPGCAPLFPPGPNKREATQQ
jgi:hypothetical protein